MTSAGLSRSQMSPMTRLDDFHKISSELKVIYDQDLVIGHPGNTSSHNLFEPLPILNEPDSIAAQASPRQLSH